MSERVDDPTFQDYPWSDDGGQTYGQGQTATDGQGEYPRYPKPLFDYPGWTPWQREVNARAQNLFKGNIFDALAPSFSERFKPGFDPNSIPPSANPLLGGPGASRGLISIGMRMFTPFARTAGAEDFLEQAIGKQIWDRQNPEERDQWWMENHD